MLSRLSGTFKGDVYRLRVELIENGVLSVGADGVPYSRRMVKDTGKSVKCSDAAKRGGGNPSLNNPILKENTDIRSHIPNANISLKVTFKGDFDLFWKAYPKKVGKKDAMKAFAKAKDLPPIADLIAEVELQARSEEWRKDNGQYIPHPATWLNRGGWMDEVTVKE